MSTKSDSLAAFEKELKEKAGKNGFEVFWSPKSPLAAIILPLNLPLCQCV